MKRTASLASALKDFTQQSQFIVITHKKRMMSVADILYGITMQESGISKQVSIRFEDWQEEKEKPRIWPPSSSNCSLLFYARLIGHFEIDRTSQFATIKREPPSCRLVVPGRLFNFLLRFTNEARPLVVYNVSTKTGHRLNVLASILFGENELLYSPDITMKWLKCAVIALGVSLMSHAEASDIGFVEDFALAKDRAEALKKLIPGTEDYYYYHCLHYLNTEQFDKIEPLTKIWFERFNQTQRLTEIQTRYAFLTYNKDPQRTLSYFRRTLGLNYPHQRIIQGDRRTFPPHSMPS